MTHEKTSSYCKPCQVGTDLFEAQFEKIFSDFRYFPVPVKSSGAIMVCIDLSGLQSCLNMWQFGDGSLGIKRRSYYILSYPFISRKHLCVTCLNWDRDAGLCCNGWLMCLARSTCSVAAVADFKHHKAASYWKEQTNSSTGKIYVQSQCKHRNCCRALVSVSDKLWIV